MIELEYWIEEYAKHHQWIEDESIKKCLDVLLHKIIELDEKVEK